MNIEVLEKLLVEAEKAHKQFETDTGQPDPHWPRYYAKYLETQLWRAGNLTHSQLQRTPKSLNWDARAILIIVALFLLFCIGWYVEGIDDALIMRNPPASWNPVTNEWHCPRGFYTSADPAYEDSVTCQR